MEATSRELDRLLTLLRAKIRQRGLTQLEVQRRLGWGRSYLSQMFTRGKSVAVDRVLLILSAIGVEPAEFFAELFHWPVAAGPDRRAGTRPRVAWPEPKESKDDRDARVEREVDRVRRLLRDKAKASGLSQAEIQHRAGWGRSYLSLLFAERTVLRFEQIFRMLSAIGLPATEFFAELYLPAQERPPQAPAASQDVARELARLTRQVEEMGSLLRDLVGALEQNRLLGEEELAAARSRLP